jgi:hypothetical protein
MAKRSVGAGGPPEEKRAVKGEQSEAGEPRGCGWNFLNSEDLCGSLRRPTERLDQGDSERVRLMEELCGISGYLDDLAAYIERYDDRGEGWEGRAGRSDPGHTANCYLPCRLGECS